MHERHSNLDLYFKEQQTTCRNYIIPFIKQKKNIDSSTKVLEVGCGYGGNLLPFLELGCQVTGIDIRQHSIDYAKDYLEIENRSNLNLICSDIYDVSGLDNTFDIIFMKDTIEHIPNQEKFIPLLKKFLKEDGVIFQGFPPWCNPFGGHQQMCKSKILSKTPWIHLLPRTLYKNLLKIGGENEATIHGLLTDAYDTGISVQRFLRICRKNELKLVASTFFLVNPNYQVKFNLKPRVIWGVFNIPWLRDFYTTTVYCLISK
jgi:2-polyprenyl-3-methyl-5-hydroxy-6-metoxy-1,4-benzoquinol methylase